MQNLYYTSITRKDYAWLVHDSWENENFQEFIRARMQVYHPVFLELAFRRSGRTNRKTVPRAFFLLEAIKEKQTLSFAEAFGFEHTFRAYHILLGPNLTDADKTLEQVAMLAGGFFHFSQADFLYFYPTDKNTRHLLKSALPTKAQSYQTISPSALMALPSKEVASQGERFLFAKQDWDDWDLARLIDEELAYLVRLKSHLVRRQQDKKKALW